MKGSFRNRDHVMLIELPGVKKV